MYERLRANIRDLHPSLAASELAKLRGDELPDGLPAIDLDAVRATHEKVREAVRGGKAHSCHDIAEGGLALREGGPKVRRVPPQQAQPGEDGEGGQQAEREEVLYPSAVTHAAVVHGGQDDDKGSLQS